jgi:hypothetical protein
MNAKKNQGAAWVVRNPIATQSESLRSPFFHRIQSNQTYYKSADFHHRLTRGDSFSVHFSLSTFNPTKFKHVGDKATNHPKCKLERHTPWGGPCDL